MTKQKTAFLQGEGDAWFARNRAPYDPERDPVARAIARLDLGAKAVLEIGCGGGARLAHLGRRLGAACRGLDPAAAAVAHAAAAHPEVAFERGTADALPYEDAAFDLVILGFCLYLADPSDHFTIAREADRVLRPRGFLVIHDFLPPRPYRNRYAHRPGLHSYKMEWSRMFLWHPAYSLLHREYGEHGAGLTFAADERLAVDVLRKDAEAAFADNADRR
jgi:ubiquinone/menaquinone biosynthesis C-methylase UbiE